MKRQLGLYTASLLLLTVAGCGVPSAHTVNKMNQPVKVEGSVQGAGFSLGDGSWWEDDFLPAPHWPYPQDKFKKPAVQPTTKKPSSSPASKTSPKPVSTKPKTVKKTVPLKPKTPTKASSNLSNPLANVRLGQELPANFNMPGASWYGQEEANWFEAQGGRIFVIKAFHTPNGSNYYIGGGSAWFVNKHVYNTDAQLEAVLGKQDYTFVHKSLVGY